MEHRIDPELKELLAVFPPLDLDNVQATRDGMAAVAVPATINEQILVTNKMIQGPEEGVALRIRIYQPKEQSEIYPAMVWIHGGGYVLGAPEGDDLLCQRFVTDAKCVVVSVDYRLAPEHPYPVPLEDCYTALKWMADHADELKIDNLRIGIAGASAGGGLTAALALLTRDRNYPKLSFQMPLYPMIDDRNNTPSSLEITGHMIWNHSLNQKGWEMYLNGENGSDNVPKYAAAARADDLTGLPFTYTCVGQLDPFRDETLQYVTKLCQAGVDVEFHLYPGCYHGFESLVPTAAVSLRAVTEYVEAAKYVLNRTVSVPL